jgi:hypothetical protein
LARAIPGDSATIGDDMFMLQLVAQNNSVHIARAILSPDEIMSNCMKTLREMAMSLINNGIRGNCSFFDWQFLNEILLNATIPASPVAKSA